MGIIKLFMTFLITWPAVVSVRLTQNVQTLVMVKRAMVMLSNVPKNEEAQLKAEVNSYLHLETYRNVPVVKVGFSFMISTCNFSRYNMISLDMCANNTKIYLQMIQMNVKFLEAAIALEH